MIQAEADWAVFDGASLIKSDWTGASMAGIQLEAANLAGANLSGTNLQQANLENANLTAVDFTDAKVAGAILSDVRGLTTAQVSWLKENGALNVPG